LGNLFQELQRRKVFRVAAVYAIVAWLLIQIAGEILPTFDAPQWVNQTIIFVLILGFPLALILAWAFEMTPQGIQADAVTHAVPATVQTTDRKLIYAILGLVLLVAGFQVSDRLLFTDQQAATQVPDTAVSSQNSPVIRFSVPVGEDADRFLGGVVGSRWGRPAFPALALSNDGSLLVYPVWEEGFDGLSSRLYSRRLDQDRAEPIAGTEGAEVALFSPDDAWIGFITEDTLRRVPVTGGRVETVVAGPFLGRGSGATWGDDGTIVYGGSEGLYQVVASGGNGELLADPNSSGGQFSHYAQPHLLPGSKVLLFHGVARSLDPERAEIIALDLATGAQTALLSNAMNPLYVAETGHLLFMRQGSLMAVRFDSDQLVIKGDPVLVEQDVMQAIGMPNFFLETGAAQLTISSSGHLGYVRGGVYQDPTSTLMRVTQEGEAEPLNSVSLANFYLYSPRLSPGDNRLVFVNRRGQAANIYLHDFARDITQQLNAGGFRNMNPVWSPDGDYIAFTSNRGDGVDNIYRMIADGSSEQPERLALSDQAQYLMSWSSQGVIAYGQGGDIWILPPNGEPAPFFTSEAIERWATFSPDGQWLAYAASSSRGNELYIRPYPGPGPAVFISGNGSSTPAWSRDGTQLYFLQTDANSQQEVMMQVDIADGKPSPARSVIHPWPYLTTVPTRSYDILEDGAFIAVAIDEEFTNFRDLNSVDEIHVVLNFFEVLRQRVAD